MDFSFPAMLAVLFLQTNACLLSDGKLLAVYLSGPLMNLFCAVLFWNCSPVTAVLHLGMGMFNLLPYRILDGGAVLEAVLENRPALLMIRSIFCMILSAVSVFYLYCLKIQNPSLYLTAVYLAFSEFAVDKCHSLW